METSVKAVYRNGVFVPSTECDFPENTEVEVSRRRPRLVPAEVTDPEEKSRILREIGQGPLVIPPEIADPEEQERHMKEVVARMQQNPVPLSAPRFTREEMHERR